jgi:hypothetical protein
MGGRGEDLNKNAHTPMGGGGKSVTADAARCDEGVDGAEGAEGGADLFPVGAGAEAKVPCVPGGGGLLTGLTWNGLVHIYTYTNACTRAHTRVVYVFMGAYFADGARAYALVTSRACHV